MFVHRTEADSNRNGVVRLRPLLDETDNCLYTPLFSKRIPANQMNVTRHMWAVGSAIWDLYAQEDEEQKEQNVIKYLVCLYASCLKPGVVSLEANVVKLAQNIDTNYKRAFTVNSFVQRFRKTWAKHYVRLSGYVSAKDIARQIMDNPATMFAKMCRASVRFAVMIVTRLKSLWRRRWKFFPPNLSHSTNETTGLVHSKDGW